MKLVDRYRCAYVCFSLEFNAYYFKNLLGILSNFSIIMIVKRHENVNDLNFTLKAVSEVAAFLDAAMQVIFELAAEGSVGSYGWLFSHFNYRLCA